MQKYRRQLLLGLGFALLVVVGIIIFFNGRSMLMELGDFALWLFLPMLILKLINWGCRYLEWHYFLRVLGVEIETEPGPSAQTVRPPSENDTDQSQSPRLSLFDSALIWMVGLPLAVSPGKVAEVLKSYLLKNKANVPIAESVPVVFAERLADGIAVVLLTAITGIIILDDILEAEGISARYVQWILVVTIIVLTLVVLIVQFRVLAHRVLKFIGNIPIIGRFEDSLHAFYNSSYNILKLRHLTPTVSLGMVGYFCDGLAFYLILTGLGEPYSLNLAAQSIFILGFSVIVAAISAMPGGAGGRDLTIGAMLTAFVGLPKAAIGVAVLLVGINQIWFGTVIGLVLIVIFRRHLFTSELQEDIEAHEEALGHKQNTSQPEPSIFS